MGIYIISHFLQGPKTLLQGVYDSPRTKSIQSSCHICIDTHPSNPNGSKIYHRQPLEEPELIRRHLIQSTRCLLLSFKPFPLRTELELKPSRAIQSTAPIQSHSSSIDKASRPLASDTAIPSGAHSDRVPGRLLSGGFGGNCAVREEERVSI